VFLSKWWSSELINQSVRIEEIFTNLQIIYWIWKIDQWTTTKDGDFPAVSSEVRSNYQSLVLYYIYIYICSRFLSDNIVFSKMIESDQVKWKKKSQIIIIIYRLKIVFKV
jgi:hypothetical protein